MDYQGANLDDQEFVMMMKIFPNPLNTSLGLATVTSKMYRRSKGGMNSLALCMPGIQEHNRVKQKSGALETIQAKYFPNSFCKIPSLSSQRADLQVTLRSGVHDDVLS